MNRPLRGQVNRWARSGCATLLVVALIVLYGLLGRTPPAPRAVAALAVSASMDLVDVPVRLPPGYATPALCRTTLPRWLLPFHSTMDLSRLLDAVGLDAEQRRALEGSSRCSSVGCSLTPSRELVLGLRPTARAALYRELGRFPENPEQWVPFRRRRELGPWSVHPGLSEQTRALLDKLTYAQGDFLLIADFTVLCAELPNDEEKVRALEALMSRGTLDAKLRVGAGADLDALVRSLRSNVEPAEPRASALLRPDDRERSVSLVELLPPFARTRLGTFPRVDDPAFSCFWTALHFFDEGEPDPHLGEEPELLEVFQRDYLRVPFEQRRLGDTILLLSPGGHLVHAVNQVAGEVVFTKNGASFLRPWVLMRLTDVQASYPAGTELRVQRLQRLAGTL